MERGENLMEKDLLELAQRRLGPVQILGPNPMGSVKQFHNDERKNMKPRPVRAVPRVKAGRRQSVLRNKGK
jgi:hypothetical protein